MPLLYTRANGQSPQLFYFARDISARLVSIAMVRAAIMQQPARYIRDVVERITQFPVLSISDDTCFSGISRRRVSKDPPRISHSHSGRFPVEKVALFIAIAFTRFLFVFRFLIRNLYERIIVS